MPSGWNGYCQDGWDFNSSMCNRKLIGAKHFTKGFEHLQSHKVENPDGGRYHSPRDGDGHGTHTASTAAGAPTKHANLLGYAEGTARGIAYNARIATYKACVGGVCPDSDLLAAMESAIQDGVHVLSLSLAGPESPYYDNLIARGGFAAMERGIFVVCAAGNSGPYPYSVVNTAPWLTTVGAGSIDRTFRVDVLLGNGQNYIGSSLFSSSDIKTDASPLVSVGLCDPANIPSYDLRAKIVVCTFNKKCNPFDYAQIIQEAGGDGMIQLNLEVLGHTLQAFPFPLPAAAVGFNDGVAILAYIERTKNPMASFKFQNDQVSLGKERAPLLASFSSRGPNPIVPEILKLDLLAPGLNILAAYIPNGAPSESVNDPRRTEFNIMSGTSMACPHVAGAAALLRAIHPSWSPAAIRSALMTTAGTTDNGGLPILSYDDMQPATALGIGSGHINPQRATDPGLVYDADFTDYVAFLCSLNYSESQMKVFVDKLNPCSLFAGSPGKLNYPSFSVVFKPGSNLLELTRTVTCVGKLLPEVYHVNVVNPTPAKVTITVEPKTLTFSNIGEKQTFKIIFKSSFMEENSTKVVENMVFGSISWVSEKHEVRSPIAVMWITDSVYVLNNACASTWDTYRWFQVYLIGVLVTVLWVQ